MGEPLSLLGQAPGRELLDGRDNACMQCPLLLAKESLVGHLVRKRVLERVLEVREEPRLVEELRGLQARELGAYAILGRVDDGQEQREWHVLADDGSGLKEPLALRREAIDAGRQDRLHGGRNRQALDRSREPVGAARADQHSRLDQRPHALLKVERIRLRPLDQETPEGGQGVIGAQERIEQLVRALRRQRIDAELAVVCLASPWMAVLRPVVDEEQQARRREALDETVEQRLCLPVDPVQVLEDQDERLLLRFAQEQSSYRVEGPLATLPRLERLPRDVVHRQVEQEQQRGQRRPQRLVQDEQLAGHLLADLAQIVARLDLEIALEEIDDRRIARGPAVR